MHTHACMARTLSSPSLFVLALQWHVNIARKVKRKDSPPMMLDDDTAVNNVLHAAVAG